MNITISFLKSLPIFSRNLDFKVQALKKPILISILFSRKLSLLLNA